MLVGVLRAQIPNQHLTVLTTSLKTLHTARSRLYVVDFVFVVLAKYCTRCMYGCVLCYTEIRKLPALHGFVARVVFCTARHCPWQAKNPHCTELHGPAGKATMHGFARRTCKWIPSFTDLHGTTWKVPVHMDPNLALLMKLNLAQRSPWQA